MVPCDFCVKEMVLVVPGWVNGSLELIRLGPDERSHYEVLPDY
jgi:hypothetical protein